VIVLDFRYVPYFRNQSESNLPLSKIEAKFRSFSSPKISNGMGEISECYFSLESRTQPLISEGGLIDLGDLVSSKNEKDSGKM